MDSGVADLHEAPTPAQATLRQLAEWVRDLQHQTSADIRAVLDQLAQRAARTMPTAQYVGVTAIGRRTHVQTASAIGRYPVILDTIQRHYGEGPALSAVREDHCVRVDELAAEDRWPRYRRQALERTPIRSVLSYRLFADRRSAGTLTFYAEGTHAFGDDAVETGSVFAGYAALAWTTLRRDEQFRSALDSRDLIGQAKGILVERLNIDAAAAFELLKRLSQESNTPVAEIARRVVNSQAPRR